MSGSEAVAIGLLRSHAVLTPGETTVLLGSGIEALIGESAAQVAPGWVYVCDSDLRTLQRAAPQLEHVSNAELVEQATLPTSLHGRCSSVLLLAPPQRDLARRWLVEAYTALREGGTLWLAGAKAEGIESVIDDAGALFGQTHVLGYRKGSRVAQAIRQPEGHRPPWASEPGIVPGTWQQVMVELPQGATEFLSLPGVFAYDRLDAGTALLLQQMDLQGGERVLDIGCGCGIIGVAAALSGAAQVDLSDVNLFAVAAAKANGQRLAPGRCRVYAADGLQHARGPYDLIVTNPPFHQGKAIDYSIAHGWIVQARELLSKGGRLLLVANRFLPYERSLNTYYEQVQLLADDGRYRVWQARES